MTGEPTNLHALALKTYMGAALTFTVVAWAIWLEHAKKQQAGWSR